MQTAEFHFATSGLQDGVGGGGGGGAEMLAYVGKNMYVCVE